MKITVIMADECSATSVTGAVDVLCFADLLHRYGNGGEEPLFQIETASLDGGPVTCFGGMGLSPQKGLHDITATDLILVPGFLPNILTALDGMAALYPWLRHHHKQGAWMGSICTGAFVLAEAGLLDGKEATTHWLYAEPFRARYPQVTLQEDRIMTEDGRVLCSGGSSAGNDLLLHLVGKFGGEELLHDCSKKLLLDSGAREQGPYISSIFPLNHGDHDIRNVQLWLAENSDTPLSIDGIAGKFGFGIRNFKRRFKAATAMNPVNYIQSLRVEKAKRLLETTRKSMEEITCEVGYEDSNSFRRLFKQHAGLSPGAFRKKFYR
ncbi:transcriptional regulator [Desulfoluna limicola]|uniref:Transcriptional regulator n=1 Tax=Desulfoluna limicola TaxID=2810562 RepID=A0ABN6F2N4_9BACT|nr:GlxA family transcriptional regulator [Desulfoluna limicola]BCS95480.1 transcriptional regulator [Desulfoluna limicola]